MGPEHLKRGGFDERSLRHGEEPSFHERPAKDIIPEKIALIHSEISEALEAHRTEGLMNWTSNSLTGPKPEGFIFEPYVLTAGIGRAVCWSAWDGNLYNEGRPWKHCY